MIEQGFNYADSTIKEITDLFETGVENLELKKEKKKSTAATKKSHKKSSKKHKQEDSNSSLVEFSEGCSVERLPNMKDYIVYSKYSYSMDNCMDLHVMVNKHKKKKKRSFKLFEKINKELNVLIEELFKKIVKNKKKRKIEKDL